MTTPDFGCITDALLDFLSQNDSGRLDEESDDPLMLVGIRRGEGDTLDVSIDGFSVGGVGGDSEPVARYRVTVERVTERPADAKPGTLTVAGLDFPVESVAQAVADAIGLEDLSVRLPDGSGDTEWEGCGAEASGPRVSFDCVVPLAGDDGEDYEERVTLTLLVESACPSDVDVS